MNVGAFAHVTFEEIMCLRIIADIWKVLSDEFYVNFYHTKFLYFKIKYFNDDNNNIKKKRKDKKKKTQKDKIYQTLNSVQLFPRDLLFSD